MVGILWTGNASEIQIGGAVLDQDDSLFPCIFIPSTRLMWYLKPRDRYMKQATFLDNIFQAPTKTIQTLPSLGGGN